MSKVLIINGANFATNKVEKITIGDAVPCTGLSLSENSISATAINTTTTLTATKTPANTTDDLIWKSSDNDVATVSDGVITFVGIGTATITATCGTQTATCSVSVTVTIVANTQLEHVDGYNIASTDLSANPPKDYVGTTTKTGGRVYVSDNSLQYKALSTNVNVLKDGYAIAIPKNTKSIVFSYPSSFSRFKYALVNSAEHHEYETGITSSKALYYSGTISAQGTYTIDLTGYEDTADSFVFNLESQSSSASSITGDVTITFSVNAVSA